MKEGTHIVAAKSIKTSKKAKARQVFGRNGVYYTFPHGERGPIQINIDFALAPEPLNYSYADSLLLGVDEGLGMAVLSFGRRDADTNKFAERIDVVMPTRSLFGQFWASSRDVENTLDQLLKATGAVAKIPAVFSTGSQAPTVFANLIFAAIGADESTLDFYHLTPREVHLAKTRRKDIQILPIIRVILATILTKHFFNTLRPHAKDTVNYPPIVEGGSRAARSY